MKRFFSLTAVFLAAIVVAAGFASCATKAPSLEQKAEKAAANVRPIQQVEVLEDKGTAFAIQTPPWVAAFIINGNLGVEALAEFKSLNCFVVEVADENKDFATTWTGNPANGAREIAQKISTTVSADASTKLSADRGNDVERNLKAASEALTNANFAGLTRNGDWWQIVRNKATDKTECRAYALYTIDAKILNDQVATYLARFVTENNKALSAAEREIYADLIAKIRSTGGVNS